MSWSMVAVGSKDAIGRKIEDMRYMTPELKSAINSLVSAMPLPEGMALLCESTGHMDQNYGHCKVEVRLVEALQEQILPQGSSSPPNG